jgi:thioredoxin reductase (NADPH)
MEEALFLTRFGSKVTVVHRRDAFRASQIMLERARQNPKIELVTNAVVDEILGRKKVEGVRLRSAATNETWKIPADGFFVAIGHDPNTKLFVDQLDRDEADYLRTKPDSTETNVPACSRQATSKTTPTVRRSPPPAPAAWQPWTPDASSPPMRMTTEPP